jgi:hypothetical protein
MVRDLAKSMISFSWAMSLFGMNQMMNVIPTSNPSHMTNKATTDFNSITDATTRQLGETFQGAFQFGDRLQKGLVDFTLDLLTLEALNPSRLMKTTSNLMRDSSAMFGQSMSGAPARGHQASVPGFQAASQPVPPTRAPASARPTAGAASTVKPRPSAASSPPAKPETHVVATAVEPPHVAAGWGPVPPVLPT